MPHRSAPQAKVKAGQERSAEPTGQGPRISKRCPQGYCRASGAVNAKDAANIPAKLPPPRPRRRPRTINMSSPSCNSKAAVDARTMRHRHPGASRTPDAQRPDEIALYMNSASSTITPRQLRPAVAEQVLKIDPNNVDATDVAGRTRNGQGAPPRRSLIQKAIAPRRCRGPEGRRELVQARPCRLPFNANGDRPGWPASGSGAIRTPRTGATRSASTRPRARAG